MTYKSTNHTSLQLILTVAVVGVLSGIAGSYWYNKNYPNQVVEIKESSYAHSDAHRQEAAAQYISSDSFQGISNTPDFVKASAVSTPTVVFIKTVSGPQYNFDWFFFGQSSRQTGTGSGVIFTNDGFIVTNNHVIENAETIEVIHDKTTYKAKLIGADPNSDLAVLKIDAKNLPIIKLADSRKVQVGEWVLAVGNPFNLTSTVTAGIVSAKGRNLNIVSSMFPIESFIQTDAAINPGNSGGALVNLNGELIGINTAIYSRTGSYSGYGFAVPSDIVAKVFNDLVKYGEVQKAFLGAEVIDITSELAEKYNLNNLNGVLVTRVDGDGAAEKAGLNNGDVILKINGNAINSKSNFDEEMAYFYPGDKVKITYKRKNQIFEITAELTNNEGTTGITKREVFASKELGADLEVVSKIVRDRYKINGGVKIAKVRGRGVMAQLGIEEGFIITKINGKVMETPVDIINALNNVRGKIVIEGINKNGARNVYQFFSGW
jgi:Do/DeqQ family serine protease